MYFLFSLLFLIQAANASGDSLNIAIGDSVPNFVLKDAFGDQYEFKKMPGNVVIMIMGGRRTQDDTKRWAKELVSMKQNDAKIFVISDMRGIPSLMPRSFIIRMTRLETRKIQAPILLDWGQKFNKAIGNNKNRVSVLVVDPKGLLAIYEQGPFTEQKFNQLKEKLEQVSKTE